MDANYAFELNSSSREFHKRPISIPKLETGQVLIEVTCCTICGSDLHTFCGRRDAPEGCVLGHEIIGKVAAWGGSSTPSDFHGSPLAKGDRVTWAMAVGCGECFFCNRKMGQKCESIFKYGHEPRGTGAPTGGLSDYCVLVPGTPIFRVPDSLSDEVACPANCATATVSAATRLIAETHRIEGSNVLVIGAGMLGLTATAQLTDAKAANVVVADVDSDRLALARKFGATECVSTSNKADLENLTGSLTQQRGFDIVLDFAGVHAAVLTALDSVRTGGCVLLAGSVFKTEPIPLLPETVVRKMLTIRGLHNYLAEDLAFGLRFLESAQTRYPFESLVSRTFLLDETQDAFEFARDQRPIRVAVRPSGNVIQNDD
ncbi:zinc-binding dehydrogenase [Mariniblastus fucicola]|uniref:Sorbitol dehydrogenase n=1 Tax=Mariniblastus fucicola TaxID=980251 RepID=A0A5B9P238_9BACT|nr:zinc-binding dehydrogenase [Mariniblastus fucicola]QEG20388.1 Sorbitol dehydrogenase [Mariniblastus fucicola]